jgi:hypothetical protein
VVTSEIVKLSVPPLAAAALGLLLLAAPASAATKPARPRGVNARTGRAVPPFSQLVKANKKNDRATLERLAARFGVAGLAEGARATDPAVAEAALAAIPLARGGVMLAGVVADKLDPRESAVAGAAARALGALLDGDAPGELADWEVPPDVLARACAGLRALAANVEAAEPARLAALDAIAAAQVTCPVLGELGVLVHDPTPAVRRAAALLLPAGDAHAQAALREGLADPDPSVSAACVASVCRGAEPRGRRAPAAEALVQQATGAARALVAEPATRPEDAVEMLTCVAAAGTPADRTLLEKLRADAAPPVRERAALLLAGGKPE